MSKLLLTDVTKNFSNSSGEVTCILKNINLEIADGEFFTLLGASGCGKSTTALTLLQLEPITSGQIFFQDQELTGQHKRVLRKLSKEMQIIFQDPYSSKHFSLFWPSLFFDIQSPGYNLGHSMSFFFRGEFLLSIKTHYLGIPCISIIIYRIITIIKMKINEWE